jgi:hypothetical protein
MINVLVISPFGQEYGNGDHNQVKQSNGTGDEDQLPYD